ncbi:extracellular solute-binding protein [Micromonospora sp. WMMD882]|uniref:ABC transporter substrate-binding protein n=1 Tax=Micromonospora sp. WMMD882 TaxID=3015151 RepID=UPI00248AB415|nr:extracellular solute-binding protein [Micromonospora sp. WMMD882]WBB80871.1 extracellular solute-binding protein [Micromonospora sp. WMMD882]
MVRRRLVRAVAGLTLTVLAAGCALTGGSSDGRTTIEFFQFKPEAIATFDRIIADFARERPDIRVRQNHVPDSETALRTRLVRDDVPDVLALNGDGSFGELAEAGIFHDFADDPVVQTIDPGILEIQQGLGVRADGEVNALPLAASANGILYNKRLFAQHGVAVPTTWAELLAAAGTFRAAGVTPFFFTLQEAWTAMPAFNAVATNFAPDDFFDKLRAEETTFADGYAETGRRLRQLTELGQPDRFARDYAAGNQAFGRGEVAMYAQGSWTLPPIRDVGPDLDIGVFPFPADTPQETRLVSGVDVTITVGRQTDRRPEALAFARYLLRPEVVATYAREQAAVPTLRGSEPTDPVLREALPWFRDGRVTGFVDHQIPPAVPLAPVTQQYLIDGDLDRWLRTLDREWEKVAARRR